MKVSEMNEKQLKAFVNIKNCVDQIIGEYENTLMDYPEGSEEYNEAYNILHNHERLVEMIYNESITYVYSTGSVTFNESAKKYLKDVRFCGKEWLVERIEKRLAKEGY